MPRCYLSTSLYIPGLPLTGGAGAGGGRRRAGLASLPGEDRAPSAAAGDADGGRARPARQRPDSGGHLSAAHHQRQGRTDQGTSAGYRSYKQGTGNLLPLRRNYSGVQNPFC